MIAEINLKELYGEIAKINELSSYIAKAQDLAGQGNEVILTGAGPAWFYLKTSHPRQERISP